ncbi:MAG: rhodanese-like domain-containing protein [Acidobacteriota bacterium]|nr:rhodanese-like domain-containing protein [Acidobacteriota bacterium]
MLGTVELAFLMKPSTEVPLLDRPEALIPGAIAILAIVVLLSMWLARMPSALRARKGGVLDPLQLEVLLPGVNPVIVDLRPREEFLGKHGHIRSAISVPLAELGDRIEEIRKESKGRPVVLVDETDQLSHQARPMFEASGFTWLYVLKGGLRAWRAGKLPVYTAEK